MSAYVGNQVSEWQLHHEQQILNMAKPPSFQAHGAGSSFFAQVRLSKVLPTYLQNALVLHNFIL